MAVKRFHDINTVNTHTWSSTYYKSLKFFSGANCLSQVTNDELKTFCLAEPLCYITCSLHCKRLEVSFVVCLLLHIGLEQSSKYHFPALNVAVGRPKFFMTCQCLSRGPDGLLFPLFCATVWGALTCDPTIRRFEGM